jgi:hypothetical protein
MLTWAPWGGSLRSTVETGDSQRTDIQNMEFQCAQLVHPEKGFHTHKKKTPWPLVRKRTIPTERPPLKQNKLRGP